MRSLLIAAALLAGCVNPYAERPLSDLPPNARIDGGQVSYMDGPTIRFQDKGNFAVVVSKEKPLHSVESDGAKWCDVYPDADGLHWKDCKTGEAQPLKRRQQRRSHEQ